MKIEYLLQSISLPKHYYNADFDMSEKYVEEANIFLNYLKEIDGNEFESDEAVIIRKKFKQVIECVVKNIKAISDIFLYYEESDLKSAQQEFDEVMDRLKDSLFIASIDDIVFVDNDNGRIRTSFREGAGYKYFRVRAVDNESEDIKNNPDELFHIPLSKKAYTNNERFSLVGFPSLYLSTMLPLAWQECGYPKKYYYSEYQYEKLLDADRNIDSELKFVALYSPYEIYAWGISIKYNHFDWWLEVVCRYLKQYPLILACAFVNHNGKAVYKQEYVIPQMLMQWVQRNSGRVQGISYFSCVDISMYQTRYCAYNIVIPAVKPTDKKKYSVRLREEFCWTRPKFFKVPLIDSRANASDKEVLYNFITQLNEVFSGYHLPEQIYDSVADMTKVCVCVYSLMLSGESADMQVILHTLDMLNGYYGRIAAQNPDDIIKNINWSKELENIDDRKKYIGDTFKEQFSIFTDKRREPDGIATIIDKYRNMVWNDFSCSSVIEVLCTEKDDVTDLMKWLHDNHLLHRKVLLKPEEETVNFLKRLLKDGNVVADDLWKNFQNDDEWIKNNLLNLKTPIICRINDISIYGPKDTKMCDLFISDFDFNEQGASLIE